jgi:hypothetical protein
LPIAPGRRLANDDHLYNSFDFDAFSGITTSCSRRELERRFSVLGSFEFLLPDFCSGEARHAFGVRIGSPIGLLGQ